jgi:hypothetical protein
VVETLVLLAGVGTDVGGKPIAADADVDKAGWWARRIQHPVICGSTTRWGCHSIPLLAFLVSADNIICNDGIAHKF